MKMVLRSKYWRVEVEATKEEQIFSSMPECIKWAEKVRMTFSDPNMKITMIKVTEKECKI